MASFEDIRDLILSRIEKKEYQTGQKIDSIRHLARITGCSTQTVSRAITQLVTEGHLRKAPRRGYCASGLEAEEAPVAETNAIGLMVNAEPDVPASSLKTPGYQEFFSAVQETALGQGHDVLIVGNRSRVGDEVVFASPKDIRARGLKGLVVLNCFKPDYLLALAEVQPNLVVLDMDANDLGIDSVSFDNTGSAVSLVQQLAAAGARRIAFLGGPLPHTREAHRRATYDPSGRERFDGWRLGMEVAGLNPDPDLVHFLQRNRGRSGHKEPYQRLLEGGRRPDAILVESPGTLLRACAKYNLPVPEMPIAGWTGKQDPHFVQQSMFTAVCDFGLLGKTGAEVLANRLENPRAPVARKSIKPQIVNATGETIQETQVIGW